jgi:rubrerythrin
MPGDTPIPGANGSSRRRRQNRADASEPGQPAEQMHLPLHIGTPMWRCPKCGQIVFGQDPPFICDFCGDAVTWVVWDGT